jgi:hypothetical protein
MASAAAASARLRADLMRSSTAVNPETAANPTPTAIATMSGISLARRPAALQEIRKAGRPRGPNDRPQPRPAR